jgi:hypothetical protein
VTSDCVAGLAAWRLSCLLEGHNYFIKWQATAIEMIIKGLQRDRAVAIKGPRLPPGHSLSLLPEPSGGKVTDGVIGPNRVR